MYHFRYEAIDWPGKPQVYICNCDNQNPPAGMLSTGGSMAMLMTTAYYSVLVRPHLEVCHPSRIRTSLKTVTNLKVLKV